MKHALFMMVNQQEIFFPKIAFTKSTVEIFYHEDVIFDDFKYEDQDITIINMLPEGSRDLRQVLIPNVIEVFEEWYQQLISSKLIHLTIPKTHNSYCIYWDKLPNGYAESIQFDLYREILKFEEVKQNVRFYRSNLNKKLNFIGNT